MSKYKVTQSAVSQLLADVRREEIAIPELQRPFVWDTVKVRDLMDPLYKGYPVGYLITWQSIGAHLKGGQVAAHQQILIDGQPVSIADPIAARRLGIAIIYQELALAPRARLVADADAATATRGWDRFLWLNQFTGFAVTLLLIWYALGA